MPTPLNIKKMIKVVCPLKVVHTFFVEHQTQVLELSWDSSGLNVDSSKWIDRGHASIGQHDQRRPGRSAAEVVAGDLLMGDPAGDGRLRRAEPSAEETTVGEKVG